jgi:hypothetical protein
MAIRRLYLTLLTLLVAGTIFAPGAGAATYQASHDAWVTNRYPARNYGAQRVMRVNDKPVKRAFVRFTVPAISGTIQSAYLRVYAQSAAARGFRVWATTAGWNQGSITYANAPAAGRLVAEVPGFTGTSSWRQIDVTSAVAAGTRAFLLSTPNTPADIVFTSREGGRAAQLVINTGSEPPPPPPPTPTAPSNTSLPTVAGTAQEGQALTAAAGSWSGSTPMTYAYQWRRCDASGGACSSIGGAASASYTLAAADVGQTVRVRVTASNSAGSANAESSQTAVVTATDPDPDPGPGPTPGTTITTNRPWNCTGALTAFGTLPIKVVSTIANGSANDNDNAVSLRGCYGDGNPNTVDLILDIRGNGGNVGDGSVGTSYDAVRIGQNARDLVVTGNAECGARNSDPSIHQDIVQALSGSSITFVDFTSGDPFTGRWTCWGAGGGWYITWANAGRPTDLICLRCILATYNQNLRIGDSLRSGARDSVFGYSRSYGIFVESVATSPVNVNNRVIRY